MSTLRSQPDPHAKLPVRSGVDEKPSDRWLAGTAVFALLMLALILWTSNGTSLFLEMAAGLWALCF